MINILVIRFQLKDNMDMVADILETADSLRRISGEGHLQLTVPSLVYKQLTKVNIKKLNDNHITVSKLHYTIRQRIQLLVQRIKNYVDSIAR